MDHAEDHELRDFVDSESRTYSGERFNRFVAEMFYRVRALVESADLNERLGGCVAIDELGGTKAFGDSSSRLSELIRMLMEVFEAGTDLFTMEYAAATLGRLVRAGGSAISDVVEEQVKTGLFWLASPRQEHTRLSGVIVLQELANAAPAVFNVHVRTFIEVIWNPLRDSKQSVREAAVAALRACLVLVEKRETRYRVKWYYRLFEETQRGLTRATSVETVHGSLLALGELLRHTGEFMLARYREVCDTVLRLRESKERLIRRAVIALIPRLAAFAPERFLRSYLKQSTEYLLSIMASPSDRSVGFIAVAEMAMALSSVGVANGMTAPTDFLHPIAIQIRDCLTTRVKGKAHCAEAIECAGTLCVALKDDWEPHMEKLLEPMIATGLSNALVNAMHRAVGALPNLNLRVQILLLDLLALVLSRRPYSSTIPASTVRSLQNALSSGDLQGSPLIRLALHTLGSFSFVPHPLLDFVKDYVLPYLDDAEPATRRAAALASCRIIERHVIYIQGCRERLKTSERRIIDAVVQRLLLSAVADPSVGVRKTVLDALSLGEIHVLDSHLGQAESLRSLFVALNDESPTVRSLAIQLSGKLCSVNPAYVRPALRKHLLQLLGDMEYSPDPKQREDSAKLLGILIHSAPNLVLPYTLVILHALLSKLNVSSSSNSGDSGAVGTNIVRSKPVAQTITNSKSMPRSEDDGFPVAVLSTLGELAFVAGTALNPEVPDILPFVIGALSDAGSASKRLVAARTLGRVIESTGWVVRPYLDYPHLLGVLLRMLGEGNATVRREISRVLGVIGALDPHVHKLNLAELQGEGRLEREGVRPQFPGRPPLGVDDELGPLGGIDAVGGGYYDLLPSAGMVTSNEEFYPTVAINALMRVLKDPGMTSLHGRAVTALFQIIKSMGLGFVPYLQKVVPVLLALTRRADDLGRRIEMIHALADLVVLMRSHIRGFLPNLLSLVNAFWDDSPTLLPHVLALLGELCRTLRDDFRHHTSELLPRFVALFADAERTGDYSIVRPALSTLKALGPVLEDHIALLFPALLRILSSSGSSSSAPLVIQEEVLQTMQDLLPHMELASHASSILHPLIRVMNGPTIELRERTLDVICSVALAVGPQFVVFIPTIKKVMARHRMAPHQVFTKISSKLSQREPPCVSSAVDWEHSSNFLALEHLRLRRSSTQDRLGMDKALSSSIDTPDNISSGVHGEGLVSLRRAWESSQRSTREDWAEWMRNFSIELLKQSPSRALRACASLAQSSPAMARELFAAAFVSCWSELDEGMQDQLVRSLEAALASPTIPPDIVTTLLNLAEFMEHDEKALPLDTRTLGALAEKCHAYAKALHYKELEFQTSPHTAVEALISINNQLRQPDAAVGVLNLAQGKLSLDLKESWYEKLQRWDDALKAYIRKVEMTKPGSPAHGEALLGQCRCLAALAEWDKLFSLCRQEWSSIEPPARRNMAPMAAHAAWQMGDWSQMKNYVDFVTSHQGGGAEGAFLSAVLNVKNGDLKGAASATERARELLGVDIAALVGESYERAYADMVRVQQLTELEEIVVVKASEMNVTENGGLVHLSATLPRQRTVEAWRKRLRGVQRNVEVWQALLSVRRLLLGVEEDVATWLKFASLCRESGRLKQSEATLKELLTCVQNDAERKQLGKNSPFNREPDVMYQWCKHLWRVGHHQEAFGNLLRLSAELSAGNDECNVDKNFANGMDLILEKDLEMAEQDRLLLRAKVHLRTGAWRRHMAENLTEELISSILESTSAATELAPSLGKAWHQWAYFNVESLIYYSSAGDAESAEHFVAPAVRGFFRAIELGQVMPGDRLYKEKDVSNTLQDILRLLTLWFAHGAAPDVEAALQEGFGHVSIDTWLAVIPQIIARIHTSSPEVRRLIHSLLVKIGRHHPQALMFPLLVACKSQSPARRAAATAIMDAIRQNYAALVEQAQLVGGELIRMAILWHEMWHEALEEASRLYFGESNVEGMLRTLLPLHEMMRKQGPTTLKEIAFVQAYGRELDEAYEWCIKYQQSRKEAELHQAWDLYYHVFKRINKQLPSLTTLDLQYVAPALVRAQGLELAVPGTYIAGEPLVTIAAFAPQLTVITSKQRPRRLAIHGSDGAEYVFLLKGHEDLRQDERVMQLFGLVNTMLATDRITAERDLSIARYAVIPLSPNSGLIGWVPNTDTLHALIREYREARKIPLNVEHRLMLGMAPDYDHLTVIQKVEVFEHALDSTSGEDLHRVLWLKSRSSEVWLERRTNYIRSTAVMSMAGYILGLGDRHPSNLMLDRYSGKLLHIDFGDCFEASMHRDKFPERVPFRLTRMMVRAMEVAGIEGTFTATCDEVMRVLRINKDSVMAMLEAFVHDPLINWRLLNAADAVTDVTTPTGQTTGTISL